MHVQEENHIPTVLTLMPTAQENGPSFKAQLPLPVCLAGVMVCVCRCSCSRVRLKFKCEKCRVCRARHPPVPVACH